MGVAPVTDNIAATLAERGKRYGDFMGNAQIAQVLKGTIRIFIDERQCALDSDQLEALDMICHKIGRILNGDPDYADSWHDIAGYAQLVADRLGKLEE